MNIKEEIKKVEEQLSELRKQLEEENKKHLPFPQKGDKYWTFDSIGCAYKVQAATDSDGRLNAYKTKEEAEIALAIAWAKQRVEHQIKILNEGWVLDWDNDCQIKYIVILSRTNLLIDLWSDAKHLPNSMYLKSEELAKQLIASHEADLLLILSE